MASTYRFLVLLFCLCGLCGCSALKASEALPRAVANHTDPETVVAGLPSYLLFADAMVDIDPEDTASLLNASKLYTAYASLLPSGNERAEPLTERGFGYARSALAQEHPEAANLHKMPVSEFGSALARFEPDDVPLLHTYALSWLLYLKARAADPSALAAVVKVELLLELLLKLDEPYDLGSTHLYLGVLKTLRPPALGGNPEAAKNHFERALALSGGRNLSVKVEYAERYARMLYDRPLHDRLLTEVVEADPQVPGFTLLNVIARKRAQELLKSAEDYF